MRWILQHKVIAIPKSSNEKRIKENADIFDFELEDDDMKLIDGFSEGLRYADDPSDMD